MFLELGKITRDLLSDPKGKTSSKRFSALIVLGLIIYMVVGNVAISDNNVVVFVFLIGFITARLGIQAFTKS